MISIMSRARCHSIIMWIESANGSLLRSEAFFLQESELSTVIISNHICVLHEYKFAFSAFIETLNFGLNHIILVTCYYTLN